MTNYRRDLTQGGTWFFTVNLQNRNSQLLTNEIDLLRRAHKHVMYAHPFTINAMVVLPDHLHAIWTLPVNDADYSTRWRLIKTEFSRNIKSTENISKSQSNKGERGIWQRRFWEHKIRDEIDYKRHVDYIHINPQKHGYVTEVVDWPWSTFHQYINKKILPSNWAGEIGDDFEFGE